MKKHVQGFMVLDSSKVNLREGSPSLIFAVHLRKIIKKREFQSEMSPHRFCRNKINETERNLTHEHSEKSS
jgi:hypothetical protein